MNVNEQEQLTRNEEESIDFRELFFKLLIHWRWFAIAVPVCIALAVYIYMIQTPIYNVEAKVMISDSKKGELGTNVMMKELGFIQGGDMFVENEIVELQSKNLMREVIKDLELNISYIKEGFPRDRNLYASTPIKILIDHPENIQDTSMIITTYKSGKVVIKDREGVLIYEGEYSQAIPMGDYQISVEKVDTAFRDDELLVQLSSYESATDRYHANLSVNLLGKNTNAVSISVKDAIPARGIDLINALIRLYNDNGVTDKQLVSTKTVEFINERLSVINRELGSIETDAERFKKENRLTDITSDAAMVMERKKAADAELLKLETELAVVKSIRAFLEQKGNDEFRLLPENLGLTDVTLASGITQYNEMVLRRNKLLMTANESNPLLISLSNQLKALKNNNSDRYRECRKKSGN